MPTKFLYLRTMRNRCRRSKPLCCQFKLVSIFLLLQLYSSVEAFLSPPSSHVYPTKFRRRKPCCHHLNFARTTLHGSNNINVARFKTRSSQRFMFPVQQQERRESTFGTASTSVGWSIASNPLVDLVTQPPLVSDTATAQFPQPTMLVKKRRSNSEIFGLYIIGVLFLAFVVSTLANTMDASLITEESPGGRYIFVTEAAEEVGSNILDAALPMTATDVVTTVLGEVTAGIAAALAYLALSLVLAKTMQPVASVIPDSSSSQVSGETSSTNLVPSFGEGLDILTSLEARDTEQEKQLMTRDLSRKAVANGDFLVAQAATLPWLVSTFGLPPPVASVASILLAAVPAEVVNFVAKRRIEKDRLSMLEMIIEREEQTRRALEKPFPLNLFFPLPPDALAAALADEETKYRQNLPLVRKSFTIEIVADLIKWLGYGVLSSEYAGLLMYEEMPLFPGFESAIFGMLAALSAQIYADCFTAVFGFGGVTKQEEVLSRSAFKWFGTYFMEAVSGATLFGVYEFAQIPAKAIVSAVLSGAADNCSGSGDYDLCMETYLVNNPPSASAEGQLRSLVTAVASILNRYTPDGFDAIGAFF